MLIVPIFTVVFLALGVWLGHALPPPYNRSALIVVVFLVLGPFLLLTTMTYNRQDAQRRAEEAQGSQAK